MLGALTADPGYTRDQVGKIDINEFATYVAVDRKIAQDVVAKLNSGKIKGRTEGAVAQGLRGCSACAQSQPLRKAGGA